MKTYRLVAFPRLDDAVDAFIVASRNPEAMRTERHQLRITDADGNVTIYAAARDLADAHRFGGYAFQSVDVSRVENAQVRAWLQSRVRSVTT